MVSADVLPISMKTDMLRPKAAMALARNMGRLMFTCNPAEQKLRGRCLGSNESAARSKHLPPPVTESKTPHWTAVDAMRGAHRLVIEQGFRLKEHPRDAQEQEGSRGNVVHGGHWVQLQPLALQQDLDLHIVEQILRTAASSLAPELVMAQPFKHAIGNQIGGVAQGLTSVRRVLSLATDSSWRATPTQTRLISP